jgi:hypothetical protein
MMSTTVKQEDDIVILNSVAVVATAVLQQGITTITPVINNETIDLTVATPSTIDIRTPTPISIDLSSSNTSTDTSHVASPLCLTPK